jgi:glycosyltransferase involved in cell wall biosynthesis
MNRAEKRRANKQGVTPVTGLWVSNAAWAQTGYGTQTKQVVKRMNADGHSVAVAANFGLEATMSEWEGIEHFPRGLDPYSNDVIHPYFMDWRNQHPNGKPYVFTLYDVWVFTHSRFDEMPVVSWVPVDHMPVPPKVAAFLSKDNVTPVAMSQYGAAQLKRLDIDHFYIPHAIETDVMKPTASVVDDANRHRTGREIMGLEKDQFIIGIVNANKGSHPVRKAFAEQLLACSVFMQDKPDAVVYLHTERSAGMQGIDFNTLIQAVSLRPDQFKFVNQYQSRIGIPDHVMAAIFTGLDVLLAPTYGEGFGLTVADAQACGTPVIVSDFSAQPELVGDGWTVGGQPLWDAAQGAWFQIPNIQEIVKALEAAYERKGEKSDKARKFIVDNYNADDVYENCWRPMLEQLPDTR